MNNTEKMLESLSRAELNYRDKLNIDLSDRKILKNSVVETVEHYKKPKFGFVPALAFSFIIIAGMGFYLKNIPHEGMHSSSSYEETSETEYAAENKFPAIEMPEKLFMRTEYYLNTEKGCNKAANWSEYSIDDDENISVIINLLSESRTEKSEKLIINGKEYFLDPTTSFYLNYDYAENPDTGIRLLPEQILFRTQDNSTVFAVLDFDDCEVLMIKHGDDADYYSLDSGTYGKVFDIVSEFITEKEKQSDIPDEMIDKEYIRNRIMNALCYFDTAEGKLVSNLSSQNFETSVEFSVKMDDPTEYFTYEKRDDTLTLCEIYYLHGNVINYDHTNKNFQQGKAFIPDEQREVFTAYSTDTEDCLQSRPLATSLLNGNMPVEWEISGFEKYLDYDCAVIEGHSSGTYLGIADFKFIVEKHTGIVLKFESFDASGNPRYYLTVKEISIDKGNSFTADELAKRSDTKNYPDYTDIWLLP